VLAGTLPLVDDLSLMHPPYSRRAMSTMAHCGWTMPVRMNRHVPTVMYLCGLARPLVAHSGTMDAMVYRRVLTVAQRALTRPLPVIDGVAMMTVAVPVFPAMPIMVPGPLPVIGPPIRDHVKDDDRRCCD